MAYPFGLPQEVVVVGLGAVGAALLFAHTMYRVFTDDVDAEAAGESAADVFAKPWGMLGRALGTFTSRLGYVFLRVTPMGARFWKNLALTAVENYRKRTGADALGLDHMQNGKFELIPIKYLDGLDDVEDHPGWKQKGRDKRWQANNIEGSVPRLGKTPLVPLDDDAQHAGSMLECRMAHAVDNGKTRDVWSVDHANLNVIASLLEPADQQALADGGEIDVEAEQNIIEVDGRAYQVHERELHAGEGLFADTIVDIGTAAGFDGTAVSFKRYKDLESHTTTPEQMKNQEVRGYLAGRVGEDGKKIIKYALILFALATLVALGRDLIPAIFGNSGGGGGGGGSMIPFMLKTTALTAKAAFLGVF